MQEKCALSGHVNFQGYTFSPLAHRCMPIQAPSAHLPHSPSSSDARREREKTCNINESDRLQNVSIEKGNTFKSFICNLGLDERSCP